MYEFRLDRWEATTLFSGLGKDSGFCLSSFDSYILLFELPKCYITLYLKKSFKYAMTSFSFWLKQYRARYVCILGRSTSSRLSIFFCNWFSILFLRHSEEFLRGCLHKSVWVNGDKYSKYSIAGLTDFANEFQAFLKEFELGQRLDQHLLEALAYSLWLWPLLNSK